jgi:hypothetical protein
MYQGTVQKCHREMGINYTDGGGGQEARLKST